MSSKLGTILSMIFVIAFLLLGADMMCMSAAYSQLDSTSITIGYLIAKNGKVNKKFIEQLEETYNIKFETISPSSPSSGDVVDFVIYQNYDPLILSKDPITLKASRSTIIGYYG